MTRQALHEHHVANYADTAGNRRKGAGLGFYCRVNVAHKLAVHSVDAHVNNDHALLDHLRLNEAGLAQRRHDDICLL